MTIGTRDELITALGNNTSRIILDKASIANQTAGGFTSLWRATGQPAQGAIPSTTAARCDNGLTGSVGFANQTSPVTSYLAWLNAACGNASTTLEIHDRIAHVGGMVLNSTTSQTVGLDLTALSVPADRIGDANYSDIQWWLEVYTDGGATASNATINATFSDATSVNLNVQAVGGTLRAGRMIPLTPLIPTGSQGKFIQDVNTVILSASTGTAGNFGFTATRPRTVLPTNIANKTEVANWAELGLPEIPNDSCLFPIVLCSTTSSGTVRGGGKIAHG